MVKKLISLLMAIALVFSSVPALAIGSALNELLSQATPTISVKDVVVNADATVAEVEVWIENNPGISSTKMDIYYDDEIKLTNVTFNSAFGAYVTAPEPYKNPQTLSLISPLEDLFVSGRFATLTFDISNVKDRTENIDISVVYDAENTFNADFDEIAFNTQNGQIVFKSEGSSVSKAEILQSSTDRTVVVQSPEEAEDMTLYVAGYCGDSVIGVASSEVNLKKGKNTFYVEPAWKEGAAEYTKIFLWNSAFEPYADTIIVTKPTIAVENVYADVSEGFAKVDVKVLNNPGISSLKMDVEYDSELKLTNVEFNNEVFGAYVTAPEPYKNPQPISLISPLSDVYAEGVLATLTFDISKVSAGKAFADISVICDEENTFNGDFDAVTFSTVDGRIVFDNNAAMMSIDENDDMSLMNAEPLTLTIEEKVTMPGEEVKVKVDISNNPGISSLKVDIAYDKVLTLKNVELSTAFGPYLTTPEPYGNPQSVSLISPLADIATNGTLATLTFLVDEDTEDGYEAEITATYDEDNVCDSDFNLVELKIVNGKVNVFDGIPGDINGDGKVNNQDAILLFRYNAGWSVVVVEKALDVTGDGKVNNQDAILLFRYNAGWDIELPGPKPICSHELTKIAEVAATCTTDGNIQYWHCSKCNKYFKDEKAKEAIKLEDTVSAATGHNEVAIPDVEPTYTNNGQQGGKKCSVCGVVTEEPTVIPPLVKNEYIIKYYVDNNDEYLQSVDIANPNPISYVSHNGVEQLEDLIVPGYYFLGWYTAQLGGERVSEIPAGTTGNKTYYAHWQPIEYTLQFACDMRPQEKTTYYTNTGKSLPKPEMDKYVFLGWSDKKGNFYEDELPVGTYGHVTLYANWASNRNRAIAYNPSDPIICEDSEKGLMLFVYEIGEVQRIPLYTTLKLACANGIITTIEMSEQKSITKGDAKVVGKTIANSTTNSSTWSFEQSWNDTMEVSESFLEESQYTREEAEKLAKNDSQTYNLTNSYGVSQSLVDSNSSSFKTSENKSHSVTNWTESGQDFGLSVDAKYTDSTTTSLSAKLTAGLSAGLKVPLGGDAEANAGGNVGGEVGGGISNTKSFEIGAGIDYSNYTKNGTSGTDSWSETIDFEETQTNTMTNEKHWNSEEGYSKSSSISMEEAISTSVSKIISANKGYASSYTEGGVNSESQQLSSTSETGEEYSSSVTYSDSEMETLTTSYTSTGNTKGSYRMVKYGKAHVFAVVGYDVETSSYFTYTYSVMDEETEEDIDYSWDDSFNDYETSVIPFEIPAFVNDYVNSRIAYTEGLEVNMETGIVEDYNRNLGTEVIIIPSYYSVYNDDGTYSYVKVKGVAPGLFKNDKNIVGVSLGNFVTEIPESAFEGCTALKEVLCPNVKTIGKKAFADCTSLGEFVLPEDILGIGELAFKDAPSIKVTAPTKAIAEAATASGAKNIILDISALESDDAENISLKIGKIESFELWGKTKEYKGLNIDSDAKTTIINGVTFTDCTKIPLVISSQKIVLDRVVVDCNGYALIMKNSDSETELVLNQSVKLNSVGENAVVGKNVKLSKKASNISANLTVTGDVLICGEISGTELLHLDRNSKVVSISEDEFNRYVEGVYTLTLDPNGGIVEENSVTVLWNDKIGEMPIPKKEYYTFDGWYTALEGGEEYTAETVFGDANVVKLYAHWTQNPVSDWVLASEVPEGAEIINNKWTYTQAYYTTTNSYGLDGWTHYNTTFSHYGATQGPVYYDPSDGSRNVWTEQYVTSSNYKTVWHYYRYADSLCGYWGSPYQDYANYYQWDLDAPLERKSGQTYSYKLWCSCGISGGYHTVYSCDYIGLPYTTDEWVSDNYATRWYYQDPIYNYHYTRSENLESASYPSGLDISNIQEWVQYRAK